MSLEADPSQRSPSSFSSVEGKYSVFSREQPVNASVSITVTDSGILNSVRLSQYAKEAVSYITDGKYNDVGVDSALAVSCTYENEMHTPEELSAGTRMAIYLSLRMALVDMLCHEKLPLCLDETLVYQDDVRAKKLISYLAKASKDKMQCFLFTCHGREALMLDTSDASVIKL